MSSKTGDGKGEETKCEGDDTIALVKTPQSQAEPACRFDVGAEQVELSNPTARQESSSSSSDEDSDDDTTWRRGSRRRTATKYQRTKWWFQEPTVKKNCCVVIGTWALLVLGIMCFIVGIALEIVYNHEAYRGIIFFVIGVLLMVPGVYAIIHVYLAARRIGRVRFTSVWFFMNSR